MSGVAVLYARKNSVYHVFDGADVYDLDRDARSYRGPFPVVAHPPCALWGRLAHLAKSREEISKKHAKFAVECVHEFGGALEHPAHSRLWRAARLPAPGERSELGCTVEVLQTWFGGPLAKPTWVFVGRLRARELPPIPYSLRPPTHVVDTSKRAGRRLKLASRAMREATPEAMAAWMIDAALASGRQLAPASRSAGRVATANAATPAGQMGRGGGRQR